MRWFLRVSEGTLKAVWASWTPIWLICGGLKLNPSAFQILIQMNFILFFSPWFLWIPSLKYSVLLPSTHSLISEKKLIRALFHLLFLFHQNSTTPSKSSLFICGFSSWSRILAQRQAIECVTQSSWALHHNQQVTLSSQQASRRLTKMSSTLTSFVPTVKRPTSVWCRRRTSVLLSSQFCAECGCSFCDVAFHVCSGGGRGECSFGLTHPWQVYPPASASTTSFYEQHPRRLCSSLWTSVFLGVAHPRLSSLALCSFLWGLTP